MKVEIELYCPNCQSAKIVKNGKKPNGKQNYLCKNEKCARQFIGDHNLTYKGCHSCINQKIKLMLVRGVGIRDISEIEKVSIRKVLTVLAKSDYSIVPKKKHYNNIEVDEFWTYVQKKENKQWLIYAYDRETRETIAYVWGKRDLRTAKKLRKQLKELDITYDYIATDDWNSFKITFKEDKHLIGKTYTVGIEGNNCKLQHRIKRAFRRTCCFSKKLSNHFKAFSLAFFYINYGHT